MNQGGRHRKADASIYQYFRGFSRIFSPADGGILVRLQSSNSLEKGLNPGDFKKSNGLIPPNIPPAIFEAIRRLFESLKFRFGTNLLAARDQTATFASCDANVRT